MAIYQSLFLSYLKTLKENFTKIAKLDFLNPDGTVAFTVDNAATGKHRGAFIQSGQLTVNLQNGTRRTANVLLSNTNEEYSYNVNKLWFGQNIRLSEGLILPDGTEFYIPQGVFAIKDPNEAWKPGEKTATLNLVDKWAYLDGTLFGNLDGIYEVPVGTNVFAAIASILALDRGNGLPVDAVTPMFTTYYNGKTQYVPTTGQNEPLTDSPYTLRVDSDNGTYADVVLGLNAMLVGEIGYDPNGRLRLDPSQDDLEDRDKEVMWDFEPTERQLLGPTYTVLNSQVFNDIIVQGEPQTNYLQPYGRAQNTNPQSDLSIYGALGRRTLRIRGSGYATYRQCQDLADWQLKRNCILKKSVTIEANQIFHIQENKLVTIRRTDKPGEPVERHLVTGFSRPIGQTGSMTINATSVEDYALT